MTIYDRKRQPKRTVQSFSSGPRSGRLALDIGTNARQKARVNQSSSNHSIRLQTDTENVKAGPRSYGHDPNHKHASSEPAEVTNNSFRAPMPVFSSFGSIGHYKQKTSKPRRHESSLRCSFMNEIVRSQKPDLPSLAASDTHSVPPVLPVASFTAISKPGLFSTSAFSPRFTSSKQRKEPRTAGSASRMRTRSSAQKSSLSNRSHQRLPHEILPTITEDKAVEKGQKHQSSRIPAVPGTFQSYATWSAEPKYITAYSTNKDEDGDPGMTDVVGDASSIFQPVNGGHPPVLPRMYSRQQDNGLSYSQIMSDTEADTSSDDTSLPIINKDSSFSDNLVYRGVGDFSYFAPTQTLRCTSATMNDTYRMRHLARNLLSHSESETIYDQINRRVERMVETKLGMVNGKLRKGEKPPSVYECSLRLRDYLKEILDGRATTGECRSFLEHEMQWAEWFVEASKLGVLHLKVQGCACRPEWDDIDPESSDEGY